MWKHALVYCCVLLLPYLHTHAGSTKTIRFRDLESIAGETSAGGRLLNEQYRLSESERLKALEWSNPEFGVETQEVGGNRETEFRIGKSFEFPWSYLATRRGWGLKLEAAKHERTARRLGLLSEIKTGYVALGLYDQQLARFQELKEVVLRISKSAQERHREGFMAGTENHLIQLVLLNLSANHQSALEERRRLLAEWCAITGQGSDDTLRLSDRPQFAKVDLRPASEYSGMLEDQPARLSQAAKVAALDKLASAESQKALPGFSLSMGVKRIGDESGSVMGISLSLPLLNTNRAAVQSLRAQQQIAQAESEIHHRKMQSRVELLVHSTIELAEMLEPLAHSQFEESRMWEASLLAYEEGFQSLTEFLNSLQIEIAGAEAYYEQLRKYYANLFELEALTGETFVRMGE